MSRLLVIYVLFPVTLITVGVGLYLFLPRDLEIREDRLRFTRIIESTGDLDPVVAEHLKTHDTWRFPGYFLEQAQALTRGVDPWILIERKKDGRTAYLLFSRYRDTWTVRTNFVNLPFPDNNIYSHVLAPDCDLVTRLEKYLHAPPASEAARLPSRSPPRSSDTFWAISDSLTLGARACYLGGELTSSGTDQRLPGGFQAITRLLTAWVEREAGCLETNS